MNILFLSDTFPPEECSGPATRVYERACYWAKWGHQVTVITCAPNFPRGKLYPGYKNKFYQVEYMQGIRVIRVKTFIAPNEGFFLRIVDFLSYMFAALVAGLFQKKPDVIIATSPQFFAAVSGWMLATLKRKPFIFELSDIWPASIQAVGAMKKNFLYNCLEKFELFLYRQATAIVALTHAFKKNLTSRGVSADKISVILNAVDLSQPAAQKKNQELMKKYDLENKFVVGYIGTHGMAHALENILNAAKLLKNHKAIQFIFVGDGAKREMLMTKAQEYELANTSFIPAQPREKIAEFWNLCDLTLVHLKNDPVFAEVIPSKLFEAMGMGLPIIIATPKGEASDIVEKEQAGIWVPAENPQALADAIQALFTDQNLLQQFAQHSRAAADNYSRETQAKKMLIVIENSVGISSTKKCEEIS